MERENDFSQGSIAKNILNLAVPMTLAQLINVLYSVVDRVYIGHLQGVSANALTGIGLALPIITIITAFANLFGMGGAPLCSIARGSHEEEKAEKVMGNSFSMLLFTGGLLMGICFIFRKPLLYLFGASSATFPYANAYISIYLCGTVFVMISLGMNQFINSQGFGKIGMLTVMLGAFTNIVLDPILIFGLDMGVQGAALATVISQGLSAAWVMKFLTGKKAILRLSKRAMHLEWKLVKEIIFLGTSGFVMSVTNGLVQIVCNATLQRYGGDIYVGIIFGMLTVMLGAFTNIVLDPILIFGLDMGVQGAALATVISQGLSAAWVMKFLTGKKAILRLSKRAMHLEWKLVKEIIFLGTSGFVMSVTNGLVQIVCNATLQRYGGDIYVGIMTVINSVREIVTMPVTGLTAASQPVIGYNYGAGCYQRVKSAIRFTAVGCIVFTTVVWAVLFLEPRFFLQMFTKEPGILQYVSFFLCFERSSLSFR